jgi:hypothetical protein
MTDAVDGPDWAGLRELPTPKPDYEALIRELNYEGHLWSGKPSSPFFKAADAVERLEARAVHAELEWSEAAAQRDILQGRLDAMTVEWGYRDGFDGRVTVEDEEHARRIGQKYSDTYETVSRLVGPWVEVKGEDA